MIIQIDSEKFHELYDILGEHAAVSYVMTECIYQQLEADKRNDEMERIK